MRMPLVWAWAAAFGIVVFAMPTEVRADRTQFEVGPWLGWAAGTSMKTRRVPTVFGVIERETQKTATSVNAGLDVTTAVTFFGSGYGGRWEVRVGPWGAFEIPGDRGAFGEGGVTIVFTQTEHASFGTFGIRMGAGYGGDSEPSFSATLWGGVRYVPGRSSRENNRHEAGVIEKVTGVRLVLTGRRFFERRVISAFGEKETGTLLFGVEFEPSFFLPPYFLEKWGGKH